MVLCACADQIPIAESEHIRLFVDPDVMCETRLAETLAFLEASAVATAYGSPALASPERRSHRSRRATLPAAGSAPQGGGGIAV